MNVTCGTETQTVGVGRRHDISSLKGHDPFGVDQKQRSELNESAKAGMKFAESTVEEGLLSWLDELGYAISHGPEIAPDCQFGRL